MKTRVSLPWMLVPVTVLCLGACEKEEAAEKAGEVADAVTEAVEEAIGGKALSAEERAEMLGLVGHLAPDTQAVMALYRGEEIVSNLSNLRLWQVLKPVIEEETGMEIEEEVAPQANQAKVFLGEEMVLAFGPGSETQVEGLMEVQSRMNYVQFRALGESFAQAVVDGNLESAASALEDPSWMMELVDELEGLMPRIEAAQVPPVLAALKISDEEQRTAALAQLQAFLGMAGGMGEPVTVEKAGASFSGLLVKGDMLAAQAEAEAEELDEAVGAETRERLIEALKTKNVAVLGGTFGDYLIVFVGPDAESLPLVAEPGESLAANDELAFVDGYEGKPVYGLLYGEEALLEAAIAGGLKDLALGIRDGIAGVEGLGETRELTALLDMVAEKEDALVELYGADTLGGVISMDQGAVFELFGGYDSGAVDHEAPLKLSGLGEGERVVFFANWASDEEYERRTGELAEVLVESLYALAGKVAQLGGTDELAEFQIQFQMFDQLFRQDLVTLADGLGTADGALGNEAAVVIDLDAPMPPLPGVPQELVEGGRFLRASGVAPVVERAKLGEGWEKLDGALRSMLKSVNQMGLAELNMLTPTSSEKNDVITWYFDALAFSDDLKPSVTVSDDWFVASTSRTQALDLVAKAAAGGGEERKGAWAELNLDALRDYVGEMLSLVETHAETLIADEDQRADFIEALPEVRDALEALGEFEAITLQNRLVDGQRRMTLKFQMR